MATQEKSVDRISLLQGTLDLLILKNLVLGPCHGQGVARLIQRQSEDVFLVDHGSLYVALQRLEDKGWIRAKWGVSAADVNNLVQCAVGGKAQTSMIEGEKIFDVTLRWPKDRRAKPPNFDTPVQLNSVRVWFAQ